MDTRLRRALALVAVVAAACDGSDRPDPIEPPPLNVLIQPTTATPLVRTSTAFSATVTGATNGGVTYSVVEGAAGGSVSGDGVYQAPSSPGTFRVRATSVADPSRHADAVVATGTTAGPEMSDWRYRGVAVRLLDGHVLVVGGNNTGAPVIPVDLYR